MGTDGCIMQGPCAWGTYSATRWGVLCGDPLISQQSCHLGSLTSFLLQTEPLRPGELSRKPKITPASEGGNGSDPRLPKLALQEGSFEITAEEDPADEQVRARRRAVCWEDRLCAEVDPVPGPGPFQLRGLEQVPQPLHHHLCPVWTVPGTPQCLMSTSYRAECVPILPKHMGPGVLSPLTHKFQVGEAPEGLSVQPASEIYLWSGWELLEPLSYSSSDNAADIQLHAFGTSCSFLLGSGFTLFPHLSSSYLVSSRSELVRCLY